MFPSLIITLKFPVIVAMKTICTSTKHDGGGDHVANDGSSVSWHLDPLVREGGRSLVPFVFWLLGFLLPVEGKIIFLNLSFSPRCFISKEKTNIILSPWLDGQGNNCCHDGNKNDAEHCGNNGTCEEKMYDEFKVWIWHTKLTGRDDVASEWLEDGVFTDQHSYLARGLQVRLPHLDHLKYLTQTCLRNIKRIIVVFHSQQDGELLTAAVTCNPGTRGHAAVSVAKPVPVPTTSRE